MDKDGANGVGTPANIGVDCCSGGNEAARRDAARVFQLIARNARESLDEIDAAAGKPIEALVAADGLARDGAESIRTRSGAFVSRHEASACNGAGLLDDSRSFAGDVVGISDQSATKISDELAAVIGAAQSIDLIRQQVATLEKVADWAAQALGDPTAAEGDARFEALKAFYVSAGQRRIHAIIFEGAEDGASGADTAAPNSASAIELF